MDTRSIKKKILIFAYANMNDNPRPQRQISWLKDHYEIEYVSQIPNYELTLQFIEHKIKSGHWAKRKLLLLKLKLYERYIWDLYTKKLAAKLGGENYDLIIAHHLKLLPIAFHVAGKAKIVFDAHEYYTEMYDDSAIWNFFMKEYYRWLSDEYLHRCKVIIAVNRSMQHLYEKNYKVTATFITNASDYMELKPSGVNPDQVTIIHHGLASPSRKLELMIEIMNHLDDRFTLTFLLQEDNLTNRNYVTKLKRMAKNNKRILFLDPLPPSNLIEFCNAYDIGMFFMPPSNINEEYSLANKFFQYVQSRLMLAVSPLPEMKRLAEAYELGVVGDNYNPQAMAEKLNRLTTDEIRYYKNRSHESARELSSDSNREKFLKIVADVLR